MRPAGHPLAGVHEGARKDDVVQPYRARFRRATGVVLVGVAQERAAAWRATKQAQGGRVHFNYRRTTVYVNHYYVYFIDRSGGPASSRSAATPPTR